MGILEDAQTAYLAAVAAASAPVSNDWSGMSKSTGASRMWAAKYAEEVYAATWRNVEGKSNFSAGAGASGSNNLNPDGTSKYAEIRQADGSYAPPTRAQGGLSPTFATNPNTQMLGDPYYAKAEESVRYMGNTPNALGVLEYNPNNYAPIQSVYALSQPTPGNISSRTNVASNIQTILDPKTGLYSDNPNYRPAYNPTTQPYGGSAFNMATDMAGKGTLDPRVMGIANYQGYGEYRNGAPVPRASVGGGGGTSYDMAMMLERSGGQIGAELLQKAKDQGYVPSAERPLNVVESKSTIPIWDLSSGMAGKNVPMGWVPPDNRTFMPMGALAAQQREGTKITYSPGGGFNVNQLIPSTQEGFTRIYPMITGGGSDYALQSGMVAGKALTPQVYDQYGLNALWTPDKASLVAEMQAYPERFSRQGAELYGGKVERLDNRTMQDEFAKGTVSTMPGRYAPETMNYAMLPGLLSPNTPKQFTGTDKLPSGASLTFASDPIFQIVDVKTGEIKGVTPNWEPVKQNVVPKEQPEFIMVRPDDIARTYTPPVQPVQVSKYQPQVGGFIINAPPSFNPAQEVKEKAAYDANAAMLWEDRQNKETFKSQTWMEPQPWQLVKNPLYQTPEQKAEGGRLVGGEKIASISQILDNRVGITPTSPAGVEIAMAEGALPRPFVSGVATPAQVASGVSYTPPDTPTTRLESVFAEYGHMTDLTLGIIPSVFNVKYTPYADMMKSAGLEESRPVLTAANMASNKAISAYQQDINAYDLAAGKSSLDTRAKENTNVEGKWDTGQASLDIYNRDAALFTEAVNRREELYGNVQSAIKSGIASGAYYYDTKGDVQVNPENLRPYGAASDWNAGARNIISGIYGITPEQFRVNAELRNIEDRNNPIVAKPEWGVLGGLAANEMQKERNMENAIFGFNKEIATNPEGLVASAGSGAQIYALTFGAGEILSTGQASSAASIAAGTTPTRAASTAVSISNVANNPVVQLGVPATFMGSAIWQTTEGFTLPSSEASMRTGSGGAHLLAMTYGGLAPTAAREVTTLARQTFPILDTQSNIHLANVRTENYVITNEVRPNADTTHAVGERSVTSVTDPYHTTLVAFDRDISLPYFIRGTPERMVSRASIVNSELLANDILAGAQAHATSGTRTINLRGELPYGKTALGDVVVTGGLRIAEVRSPRTMAETIELGGELTRFNGRPIDQNVNALLAHDTGRAPRVTSQRNLGGYMYREDALAGTTLYESVDWIANPAAGTTHLFNPFDINRHIGRYTVEKTGGVGGDYSYDIHAQTAGGRTTGVGNIEITGAATPEALVVAYGQQISRGIERGVTNEWTFGLNRRGQGVSLIEGEPHAGSHYYDTVRETVPNAGDIGTVGHSHPAYIPKSVTQELVLDLIGDSSLGIKPDWTFSATRSIIERNRLGAEGYSSFPSQRDVQVYARRDAAHARLGVEGTVERELLVSPQGVRVFYPDQAGGWGHYQNLVPTQNRPFLSTLESRFQDAANTAGVRTRFYGTNEVYVSPESYVERVRNTPAEIAAITPDWARNILRDQTYREILGDPTLEFSVEHRGMRNTQPGNAPAPLVGGSLLTSGSNLGRNRNTATPRYEELTLPASPYESARQATPASRQVAVQQSTQKLTSQPEVKAASQDSIRAYSFASEQSKAGNVATVGLPVAVATPYRSPVQQVVTPQKVVTPSQFSIPAYDIVKAYTFGQQNVPATAQKQDIVRIFTPISQQGIIQQPGQVQRPQQYTILPQVLQETIPVPPPPIPVQPKPIVPIPVIPIIPKIPLLWGGSGGGSFGSAKPQGRARSTDIFRYGQGIGSFGSVTPINFGGSRKSSKRH